MRWQQTVELAGLVALEAAERAEVAVHDDVRIVQPAARAIGDQARERTVIDEQVGVQMLKQVVTALKMVPLTEAVSIPFVRQFIDDEGRVQANETMNSAADQMLDEMERWHEALQSLRARELVAV